MFGTAQTTVIVHINDVNEPPEFLSSHYTTVVSEGAGVGERLFSGIVAFDLDEVSGYVISRYKIPKRIIIITVCSRLVLIEKLSYQWFIKHMHS